MTLANLNRCLEWRNSFWYRHLWGYQNECLCLDQGQCQNESKNDDFYLVNLNQSARQTLT
jgi:hypothetical protein